MTQLGDLLGKGSDGEVYELIDKDSISKKVIKFIQPTSYGIKNYMEFHILLNLKYKHLLGAEKIEIDDKNLIKIIQERADCDLKNKIKKNINKLEKLSYMRQLILAINFLQKNNIIHGDIKPENILLSGNILKLTDFSLSHLIKDDKLIIDKQLYTCFYRPPEIKEKIIYIKSDIWPLGCTLYEIYYNQRYFNLSFQKKLYHLIIKEEKEELNILFNSLIYKMLEKDPTKRIGITEVNKYFNILEDFETTDDYYNDIELTDKERDIYFYKLNNKIYPKTVSKKYLTLEKKLINNRKIFLKYKND